LSLDECRGKVIALHAFQMLCPGCVQEDMAVSAAIATLIRETA